MPTPPRTPTPPTPADILGPDGPIARALRARSASGEAFETRHEQLEMAAAVARAMQSRSRLLVEAGTGVGKSFAYLVPAILRCVLNREKVVVATATISLQEQLVDKDIPLLQETLKDWGLGEHATALVPVLAKGRGNYVSIRRLRLASKRQDSLLPDPEQRYSLHQIEDWAYRTHEGSLSTLPALARPEVWDHVRSDSDNCMGRKCEHYKDCFYQKSRRELEKANLIICNHALFFSDLAMRAQAAASATNSSPAILPSYHHVVFDEAHNLEEAAAGHFGLTLTEPRVRRLLRTLYSSRRRKGYLAERSVFVGDTDSVDRAINLVLQAEDAAERFFEQFLDFHRSGRSPTGRIRAADAAAFENRLTPAMTNLAIRLRSLRENVKNEMDRFELTSFAKRAEDIALAATALVNQSLVAPRAGCSSETIPDPETRAESDAAREKLNPYVYWVEVTERGGADAESSGGDTPSETVEPSDAQTRTSDTANTSATPWSRGMPPARQFGGSRFIRNPRITLSSAPVDVAPFLKRFLFDPAAPISTSPPQELDSYDGDEADAASMPTIAGIGRPSFVLTSATLATRTIRDDEHSEHAEAAFAHCMNALGIPGPPDTRTLQLGSPFDYPRQVRIFIDLTTPNPSGGAPRGSGGWRAPRGSARKVPLTTGPQPARNSSHDHSYTRALAQRIDHHIRATEGGAFVLFTSFATLNAVANLLRPGLEDAGFPLYCQGAGGSRALVLKNFLEADNAVLFGAASFWQGVDVRGERLRNVIIARLPFEPPDRPLTQARLERLETLGMNPFAQDSLPRAIIRFKQGFGRLIRSKTDTGRVVILDPRVATTSYGRAFLSALPPGIPIETI